MYLGQSAVHRRPTYAQRISPNMGRRQCCAHQYPPPHGLVPGGYGVVDALVYVLYFLTLVPQVQYVTLVMDLGPPALPSTRLGLPHLFRFFDVSFFDLIFDLVFGLILGTVLKPKSSKMPLRCDLKSTLENYASKFRLRAVF